VLAVTSPATGACAEVTAHGTELELRCHSGPAGGAAGLITAQVAAVLTASAGGGAGGAPPAAAGQQPEASPVQRLVLLAQLRAELAGLGVRASPQPGGRSLGIWPGLYAGLSQDGTRYGWTAEGGIRTHPCDDAEGAARRIRGMPRHARRRCAGVAGMTGTHPARPGAARCRADTGGAPEMLCAGAAGDLA